jgi:protein TonB
LHLAVLWALLNGLQIHNAPLQSPGDVVADVIDKPLLPPDKAQPPEFRPDKIRFTEPVRPDIDVGPIDGANPITTDDRPPRLVGPTGFGSGTAEPEPVISPARVDPHHPLTQPPYPMAARRGDEQGALIIDILVGADGRVRDAKVSQSSGFNQLDQAALSEAKQHWHLKPATRNGAPFEQWLTLKVVFRLEGGESGRL